MKFLDVNLFPAWNSEKWETDGEATVDSFGITIPEDSSVLCTLDTSDAIIASNGVKMSIKYNVNTGFSSDCYEPTVYTDVELVYSDGSKQNVMLMFSTQKDVTEDDILYYVSTTTLETDQKPLLRIEVRFINDGGTGDEIFIKEVTAYKSADTNTEQVEAAVSNINENRRISRLCEASDGMIVVHNGGYENTIYTEILNGTGHFGGFMINNKDTFTFEEHTNMTVEELAELLSGN